VRSFTHADPATRQPPRLLVAPRWPSTRIQLEEEVLQRLLDAQAMLPAGLRLLLTRGFEPSHSRLGSFRRACVGSASRVPHLLSATP
jgi:hypothetical protein